MSDLIERQTAINAIDELPNCYNGYSDTYDKSYIIGVLEELPSAEQKMGKWIKTQYPFEQCSVCGAYFDTTSNQANYCCVCGAKMEA